MKRIGICIIVALMMLICIVHADIPPINTPTPNHLAFVICHDGPFAESSKEVRIYARLLHEDMVVTTTTTGIPYKWSDGPVVPQAVTIPPTHIPSLQVFTVRTSSEDVNGNVWPAGNYTGKVSFTINGKDVPVRVRLRIAECTDSPPKAGSEFPVLPGFPGILTSCPELLEQFSVLFC